MFYITLIRTSSDLEEIHFNFLTQIQEIEWLKEKYVARTIIENEPDLKTIHSWQDHLAPLKIDVFCTPIDSIKKKLFLADMDATIVTTETLDELAQECGIGEKVSKITDRAMRGELDFHQALKERVALIKDLPEISLKHTLDNTVLSKGAIELVSYVKQQDIFCVLVSGGFTYFTSAIADDCGFDTHHGNHLDIAEGKLTGYVVPPILDKDAKLDFLKKYVQQLDIPISDTVAIGDGANDLPMLEAAGLGIGYHPKALVREKIMNCIIHTDLLSVQYIL